MAIGEKPAPDTTSPAPSAERTTTTQFSKQPAAIVRRNTANTANRRPTTETERRESNGNGPSLGRTGTRQTMLSRITTTLTMQDKKLRAAPPVFQQIKFIILSSWFNVLLIFIPLSWAFHFAHMNNTLVFVFSFFAIMPLAKLLSFATEEISLRTNQTIAGLLNATLGNAVELIVAIIALTKCQLQVVQASLVGSILSNLLLVLGMCFFAGGTRFSEQGFGNSAAQINSSLLVIAVMAVLLPAAFDYAVTQGRFGNGGKTITEPDPDYQFDILHLSHGVAIILLLIYVSYIIFQLYTHTHLYVDKNNPDVAESKRYNLHPSAETATAEGADHSSDGTVAGDTEAGGHVNTTEEEEEEEQPQTSMIVALVLLAIITVLVAITAEFLVDSINGLTDTPGSKISKEFVSIILLAIVGNAAEHVTAVTVSVKDKLTLSIGVAVGSSIQIALFVIPFMVTLGWIIGIPLTLLFDPLESVVLFFAVLTVNYVVADGKSNWLEGAILCFFYVIVAVIFWFYPGSDPSVRYDQLTCHPRTR